MQYFHKHPLTTLFKPGKKAMSDRIWVTWETQRRNRTLSALVNAKLIEFDLDLPAWKRYPIAMWKTLSCIASEKPRIIFAQNPSLVLAYLTVFYANILGKKIIIDAHNAGLFPAEGRHLILNWLASKLLRWSTLTIVTNDALKTHVESQGGKAISIPDPIPEIEEPANKPELMGDFNVLFICSWAEDEPYAEVLRAASKLGDNIYIYITGSSKGKLDIQSTKLPGNVVLTGYVSEDQFNELLFGCNAVMALTTRENCLLCGAYEGVSAGKPLLLTNTDALKSYFCRGALYVENDCDSIAENIKTASTSYANLERGVNELKALRHAELPELTKELESKLQSACP